jgi:hypothetical protein
VPNTGEFFVTSDMMATLPATPATAPGAVPTGTSTLSVGTSVLVDLKAPGTDVGFFSFLPGAARNVQYQ